jgi:hypothetical protein
MTIIATMKQKQPEIIIKQTPNKVNIGNHRVHPNVKFSIVMEQQVERHLCYS